MANKRHSVLMLLFCISTLLFNGCAARISATPSSSTGISGSMARFTITNEFMYAVSWGSLSVFNLKKRNHPQLVQTLDIGWGIETIFSYKDLLFFGTRTGMLIYSITNPENPNYVSEYRHVNSCDPIVVEDGYAYVTLRRQAQCRMGKNELQIYDIKDPVSPILIKSYPMKNPWGLGIDDKKLFISDGKYGLKIFDASNPEKIQLLETIESINGYDVIPYEDILVVSARDGIYQFDYSTDQLKKLSRIPVGY